MRNKDTCKGSRIRTSRKKRRKYIFTNKQTNVEQYETEQLSKASKKSCSTKIFEEHLKLRKQYEHCAWKCYEHSYFRQSKFSVYCKTKSSEQKFVNDIKGFIKDNSIKNYPWMKIEDTNLIKNNYQRKVIDKKKNEIANMVILYGNWGRSPNIKNNQPTPGIGLRRRIHKQISTITTPEHMTSKTCPCCQTATMKNPTIRSVMPVKESYVKEKHHLLRCTNVECKSRWWNRNVSASFNILLRGLTILENNRLALKPGQSSAEKPEYFCGESDKVSQPDRKPL
jgi:hypothetical protein